jgi:hypothetical protein
MKKVGFVWLFKLEIFLSVSMFRCFEGAYEGAWLCLFGFLFGIGIPGIGLGIG